MKKSNVKIKLLFADEGSYHHEVIEIPAASVQAYDRLIDCVREDPVILKSLHVDMDRLCAAYLTKD